MAQGGSNTGLMSQGGSNMGPQWGQMNPYEQATGAQNRALRGTHAAMQSARRMDPNAFSMNPATMTARSYNAAQQAGPATVASQMRRYQNPFETQVIDRTTAQMQKARDMQQEQNRASAAAAGAFGGGRHGLVEAVTNADTNRQIGDMSAQLRQQGFNTAAGLAGQDVSNQMNVNMANQAARNQQRQFNTANRMTAQQQNQAARNAARQFNKTMGMQGTQNQFANQLQAASQLSNLGNRSYQRGVSEDQAMAGYGDTGQQMQQALIGQGAGMFDRYVGSPTDILNLRNAALNLSPMTQTGTQTSSSQYNPGLMDFLGLAVGGMRAGK